MDLISKELSECQHANLADYTVGINMQGAEASAVEANARLAIIDRKIKREPDEQETTLTKRSRPALHDQDPEDVADWENSQWTCHVCTFENDGSKTKCGMCSVKGDNEIAPRVVSGSLRKDGVFPLTISLLINRRGTLLNRLKHSSIAASTSAAPSSSNSRNHFISSSSSSSK